MLWQASEQTAAMAYPYHTPSPKPHQPHVCKTNFSNRSNHSFYITNRIRYLCYVRRRNPNLICWKMEESEKPIMLIGIDDSSHSFYALEWTLNHFFSDENTMFKLIIIYARPIPSAVIGLAGPGAAEVLPLMEIDLKRVADRVVHNAKELCNTKSVKNVSVEVVEGDPRKVMCEVVDKYHASVLVVGSHGYGPIQRAFLGSVSDHCAHHAHCSVMIVKEPTARK